jgi:hypothetical protein
MEATLKAIGIKAMDTSSGDAAMEGFVEMVPMASSVSFCLSTTP